MTKTQKLEDSPFKQSILNLSFHNFPEIPIFTGIYSETSELGEGEEKFLANVFVDIENGEMIYITNSYSIEKAIKKAHEEMPEELNAKNVVFRIEFLGKTEVKGKPFNQFNIGYCTLQQYESFYKDKKPSKKE